MTLALIRTSTPQPALTVPECKRHAGIDDDINDWDSLFQAWLAAAIERCEEETGRQLCTATWEWRFAAWPAGRELAVPKPPFQAAGLTVKYYDADNQQQTLSTDDYTVDVHSKVGRIILNSDKSWPNLYDRWDAVLVTFTAGYGTREDVPNELRVAMRELVAFRFRHREPVLTGTIQSELPFGVRETFLSYAVKRRIGV